MECASWAVYGNWQICISQYEGFLKCWWIVTHVFLFWRCRLLLVCLKPHWAYDVILHLFSCQPVEPRREGKQAVHLLWLHFWCFSSLCLYKCYTFLIFFCLRFLITSLLSLFSTSYYTTLSKTAELNTDTSFAFIKTEIALWEIHIMIMTGLRLYLQRFLCPPLRYTIKSRQIFHITATLEFNFLYQI